MTQKTKKIIGWVLTGVLTFVFLASASMKLMGSAQAVQGAASMGLSIATLKFIGVIEALSILLFIIPRTGLLGTLLLAAYLGGAIATHLEHAQPFTIPAVLQCIVWITALIRFPELGDRLLGKLGTS